MYDFIREVNDMAEFLSNVFFHLILFFVGIATFPVWIIPYLIYKLIKQKQLSNQLRKMKDGRND